jgi:DNA polymerase-1
MLVGRSQFERVVTELGGHQRLSLDTETTGLRPYHGDRLFSIIIASQEAEHYFNFQPYEGVDAEYVLTPLHLAQLKQFLFSDPSKTWYIHNARFDQHMLWQEAIELVGRVHCTKMGARLEFNQHWNYGLDDCAERIGQKKDDRVVAYMEDHGLHSKEQIEGRKGSKKNYFYDRVPLDIIVPYGLQDARVGFNLGEHQEKTFNEWVRHTPPKVPSPWRVVENERRLQKTVFRMERVGLKIDRPYVERAVKYERDRMEKAQKFFKVHTGRDYMASPKLFAEVFATDRDNWAYTEKKNPSFESIVLEGFQNPAAKEVLAVRDAKSRMDFYTGFLYHSDRDGVVHPNFDPSGAATGRFSSSNPNFQNLTAESVQTCRRCGEGHESWVKACKCGSTDLEEHEFLVRRAIIPRPGYVFIMPDYDQMEYRMLFDQACKLVGYESALVKKIKYEGLDPHQATADLVSEMGTPLTRKRAKNGNFANLYQAGDAVLAKTIGGTTAEARALKNLIAKAAPEVAQFCDAVMRTAETRGFIFNWIGRRCYLPRRDLAYQLINHLIQGGTADVNKVALNLIDERCLGLKSRLVATIHDENPLEVHESEIATLPSQVVGDMEGVYPHTYLPLTAGMEWSARSLGDKQKGFPV